MKLSNGRSYLAIPGPSVMPEEVLREMHRSSPNIYEGDLIDMTAGIIPDLKRVARTEHNAAIYISNGHGAWEAALSNVIAPGERILVPATGRFGHGWADMAAGLGADIQTIDFGRNRPFDLNRIEEALRADKDCRIKAVLATHVDTSSSVLNDVAGLRAVLDETGHPALLMADCIASLACDRFEMDEWGVDVMVAASQKGLMTPPGLGFVFAGPRAVEARAGMERVSRYWDWTARFDPEGFYQYFGGTAPTHHLFGLRKALDMIHAEGMENVWRRHDVLARAIWAAAEVWGRDGPLSLNVAHPEQRAHSVTSLRLGLPYGHQLRSWVEENAGVTLGIGLGMSEEGDPEGRGFFRIGHMGHVNAHMVLGLLGTIETAFTALNVPHGKGALEAASAVMAAG